MDMPWDVYLMDPACDPERNNDEDAGWDLRSRIDIEIPAGEQALIPLGIKTAFPKGYVGILYDRSGIGSKGYGKLAGVIDCGWRGEWKACIRNYTQDTWIVSQHMKCIQVVFHKLPCVTKNVCKDESQLGASVRGENGFGSTGD